MAWLFGQVWVLCLIAFLLGALVTWLVFVLPGRGRAARSAESPAAGPARATGSASADSVRIGTVAGKAAAEPPPAVVPEPAGAPEPVAVAAEPVVEAATDPVVAPAAPSNADRAAAAAAESAAAYAKYVASPAVPITESKPEPVAEPEPVAAAEPEPVTEVQPVPVAAPVASANGTGPVSESPAPVVTTGSASSSNGAAISVLGLVGDSTGPTFRAGPYAGSALPKADGSAPSAEFTIKGNGQSMLYHTTASPYYGRTKPEAWFRTAEDAEKAGFKAYARR